MTQNSVGKKKQLKQFAKTCNNNPHTTLGGGGGVETTYGNASHDFLQMKLLNGQIQRPLFSNVNKIFHLQWDSYN